MTPNTDTIVPQLRQKFEALIDYVSGSASANEDLYSKDVAAFYAQPKTRRDPAHSGSILVVQSDGKGVPMSIPVAQEPARLGRPQRRGTKKEAVVTCLYTIAPYVRSAEEVTAAILHLGDKRQRRRAGGLNACIHRYGYQPARAFRRSA